MVWALPHADKNSTFELSRGNPLALDQTLAQSPEIPGFDGVVS